MGEATAVGEAGRERPAAMGCAVVVVTAVACLVLAWRALDGTPRAARTVRAWQRSHCAAGCETAIVDAAQRAGSREAAAEAHALCVTSCREVVR